MIKLVVTNSYIMLSVTTIAKLSKKVLLILTTFRKLSLLQFPLSPWLLAGIELWQQCKVVTDVLASLTQLWQLAVLWLKDPILWRFFFRHWNKLSLMTKFLVVRFGRSSKLNPRFVGPYTILESVGPLAYQLAFPPFCRQYIMFFMSPN